MYFLFSKGDFLGVAKVNKHITGLFILIFVCGNVKQFISFHCFTLPFLRFVRLGAIQVPLQPSQDCIAHSINADFMGFSGWKKEFIAAEYLLFMENKG